MNSDGGGGPLASIAFGNTTRYGRAERHGRTHLFADGEYGALNAHKKGCELFISQPFFALSVRYYPGIPENSDIA